MVTATGKLIRESPYEIIAIFFVDGGQQSFRAEIGTEDLGEFYSSSAELTYDSVDDVAGRHTWSGRIGPNDFLLEIGDGLGMTIKGELAAPGLEKEIDVDGEGEWVAE